MVNEKKVILVIEDDYIICSSLAQELETNGFTVFTAVTASEALKVLNVASDLDLIITDILLGGDLSGLDVAKSARKMHPNIPIVYISGLNADALKENISNSVLLTKPVSTQELVSVINNFLEEHVPTTAVNINADKVTNLS